MAKRRFRSDPGGEKPPEQLSPEERRARRREERERGARGRRLKDTQIGWRRAIVPGAVAGSIVIVVVFFLVIYPMIFHPPCLQFGPIPDSSGLPAFPAANTTDFAGTWCPTASALFSIHPQLTISLNGGTVGLPPSIGRSANFTAHACILPLHTQAGLGPGIFNVTSPWTYEYTLGEFFNVWQQSYVSAFVNGSYSTRTIDYTATQILGLPVDGSHSLTLFVDNQPSQSGPGLVLNSLNNVASSSPSCIDSIYGSGHTIALVYHAVGAGAVVPIPSHPALATLAHPASLHAVGGPSVPLPTVGSGSVTPPSSGLPPWLLLRPVP